MQSLGAGDWGFQRRIRREVTSETEEPFDIFQNQVEGRYEKQGDYGGKQDA